RHPRARRQAGGEAAAGAGGGQGRDPARAVAAARRGAAPRGGGIRDAVRQRRPARGDAGVPGQAAGPVRGEMTMDFALTPEQELIQKTAREFAMKEVLPQAAAIDREHRFPAELVRRMAELGFLGMAVPEEHGGAGLDTVTYVLVMEEISRA